MAFPTYHKRFSVSCCHNLRPCGSVKQPLVLHISKFANVVYFNIFFASTQFTGICQQSFYVQFSPALLIVRQSQIHRPFPDTQFYIFITHRWVFFQQQCKGFLPGRGTTTCKQGTSFPLVLVVVVLYFFFCFFIEDLCLQANVFSKEVSITQYSVENHDRFCARI